MNARTRARLGWALLWFALVIVVAAPSGCKRESTGVGSVRIAVIPKGTTHEFWKSVHAGAVKASQELGVEIIWKGPLREDDLKAQIDVVQSFAAQGVSGMVVAPLSDKGLVGAVHQAVEAKIPVVIFDSDLLGHDHTSFVATDNFAAGQVAGQAIVKLVGGKGKVLLLRYNEGSASTTNRENGFLDVVRKTPGIAIVSDNQYGGATTESAFSTSENLLSATKAGDGGVDAIFCPNESTTFGMLLALEKTGIAGKIKFVGFDSSAKLVAGLKQGHIHGLVLQNPFKMGYLAIRTLSRHLKGEKVEPRIDTGATLVTRENLDQPEIQELVLPDLKKWLKE
jgi:ribose transport system substrate-binding protein